MTSTSMQKAPGTAAGLLASTDVAVVAVDFSPASVQAARAVLPMLSPGGRVVLVHVRSAVSLRDDTAESWNELYARRCNRLLDEFRRQLRVPSGVTVETRFLQGEVANTVTWYAERRGAGLIACGQKLNAQSTRATGRGVSSRLLRAAHCPVLVIPETPTDAAVQ